MARQAVIITGASGGIGQALVNIFSEAGYLVIGTDIDPAPEHSPSDHFVTADLKQSVDDQSYANRVFTEFRQYLKGTLLKALINNAALQTLGDAETLTRKDWQDTLNVNLLAPFFWTQAFLPELDTANGSVINIGSIHGRLTKPGFIAYATSKAALTGLTRSLAVELGSRVRVNAIAPAAISTPMLDVGFIGRKAKRQQLDTLHPVGRIGNVDEVARLALYLASDPATFINGAVIPIDGGIGARLCDPI